MEPAAMTDSYREVLSWLRGGDISPDPEMETLFIDTLVSLVGERLQRIDGERLAAEKERRRRSREACASMRLPSVSSLSGLTSGRPLRVGPADTAQESRQVLSGEFGCLDIDSVTLARALVRFGTLEGHAMNMSQMQSVLYVVYGQWLASRHERITAEHPRMWEYGPVFPRAYGSLCREDTPGVEEFERLKEEHNELWLFLGSCFRRFAWTPGCVLVAPHVTATSPWGMTRKANPDKWGAVIEDSLIAGWFSRDRDLL